jgi:lantibiotic modifying enzyme
MPNIRNLGIFTGWGSLIYTMALLSKTRKESRWTDMALSWIKRIQPCELAVQETNHGLVNGSAGFIIACLAAYKASKENAFLELADKLSGVLLRSAFQTDDQLKWKGFSKQPLAGLSHGASGYALCFARLYHHTGTRRYKDIVRKILNYENHLYNSKEKNWPDLRDFVMEENDGMAYYSTAWSHGAPGIGLARIELMKQGIRNRQILKDLDIALETTLNKGFGGGHSLCYGNFGNLELLINLASFSRDDQLRATYRQLASSMLQEGIKSGFQLARANRYTPGLMNGITGVIYQSLRVHDPEKVPSLLSLSI